MNQNKIVALAAAAHPDDIEFLMAGTLLLLKEAGAEIHMWNLSNGHCGSSTLGQDETSAMRWKESLDSAGLAGAFMHPPVTKDIAILYTGELISRVAAVVREIQPTVMLVPSPQDYMEDHQTASRLLVTGAFTRGMNNFETAPGVPAYDAPVAIYHAMPHGLRDCMRQRVRAGQYVDTGGVIAKKREMLSMHRSQKEFLDVTQEIDAYLDLMESMAREVGAMSGRYEFAEGWRRHSHWGLSSEDFDPLADMLPDLSYIDENYEKSLET